MPSFRYVLVCISVVGWFLSSAHRIEASDVRLALLVANQSGWHGDPHLRYAVRGDLEPLARTLRGVGFEVLVLKNRTSQALRAAFRRIQKRVRRTPRVHTFFFYYSGHADQNALHMGRRTGQPLRYQELALFLSRLSIKRRIAVLDACYSGALIRHFGSLRNFKTWKTAGRSKGVRKRHQVNIRKWLVPQQGREQGIRILASSLGLSWELEQYRASIFTHHFLRGLRGYADLDRDGRVSIDELFDFTSREVLKYTGQRPQQMVWVQRSRPYAIAPAYHSRLYIASDILGHIQVSIANFVWSKHKQTRRALRLAVINGKGTVYLKRAQRCFQQNVIFPKHGEAYIHNRWRVIRCPQVAQRRKGQLHLHAVPYRTSLHTFRMRPVVQVGAALSRVEGPVLGTTSMGAQLHMHWKGWGLGLQYAKSLPSQRSFGLDHIRLIGQWEWPWFVRLGPSVVQLSLGTYVHVDAVIQYAERHPVRSTWGAGLGAHSALTWWFSEYIGVRLGGVLGVRYMPTQGTIGLFLEGQLQCSVVWAWTI